MPKNTDTRPQRRRQAILSAVTSGGWLLHPIFISTYGIRRIIKSDVQTFSDFANESGTIFVCSATDSYHIIPLVVKIYFYIFGPMVGQVNTHFIHHFNGFWIHLIGRFSPGRMHFNVIIKRLKKSVCHLTAATVTCT